MQFARAFYSEVVAGYVSTIPALDLVPSLTNRRRDGYGRRRLPRVDPDERSDGRVLGCRLRLNLLTRPMEPPGDAWPINRKPRGSASGETESRFSEVYRVKVVGLAVEGIPTDDAVFRASAAHRFSPARLGRRRTTTPEDLRAWLAGLRGPGRLLRGDQGSALRPEHLVIQIEVLGASPRLLTRTVYPPDSWTKDSASPRHSGGHPFRSPP